MTPLATEETAESITFDEMSAQKMDKMEKRIEQVVLNTALIFLTRFYEKQNLHRNICYKADCSMRGDIPF